MRFDGGGSRASSPAVPVQWSKRISENPFGLNSTSRFQGAAIKAFIRKIKGFFKFSGGGPLGGGTTFS